ncbi:hypothetical protein SDJN03_03619, partial [Cucurbita argyrosperma subsp. sororia]
MTWQFNNITFDEVDFPFSCNLAVAVAVAPPPSPVTIGDAIGNRRNIKSFTIVAVGTDFILLQKPHRFLLAGVVRRLRPTFVTDVTAVISSRTILSVHFILFHGEIYFFPSQLSLSPEIPCFWSSLRFDCYSFGFAG